MCAQHDIDPRHLKREDYLFSFALLLCHTQTEQDLSYVFFSCIFVHIFIALLCHSLVYHINLAYFLLGTISIFFQIF